MNTQTNTQTSNPSKKFVLIDNRISFFNAVERYVEKLAKVAGNEPARLCYPQAHVTDGILHVVSIEGKNLVKPIHGVTLINTQDESYHTVRNGWISRERQIYALEDGAEFILNGKHYIYYSYHTYPIWVEGGRLDKDNNVKYTTKRRFENVAELDAWRAKTGYLANVIRFLPMPKGKKTKPNHATIHGASSSPSRTHKPLVSIF